jgi:hypothetical protein
MSGCEFHHVPNVTVDGILGPAVMVGIASLHPPYACGKTVGIAALYPPYGLLRRMVGIAPLNPPYDGTSGPSLVRIDQTGRAGRGRRG